MTTDSLALLDEALSLGERELGALAAGDVDAADLTAAERERLLHQAWEQRAPETLDALRDRLVRLQCLQGKLTEEARRLHTQLRSQLQDNKREVRRLRGYGRAAQLTRAPVTLGHLG
mgnify:CR=1 FL=1